MPCCYVKLLEIKVTKLLKLLLSYVTLYNLNKIDIRNVIPYTIDLNSIRFILDLAISYLYKQCKSSTNGRRIGFIYLLSDKCIYTS